jgi:photosystem II stability/assembly factor-like uncharacterized protein
MSGSNIFAGTLSDVYSTNDSGNTWSVVNNGMPHGQADVAANGSSIFAAKKANATFTGGIFLSTDLGNNWSPVNHGFTNIHTYTLAAFGSAIFLSNQTFDGLFMSADGGDSWVVKNNGLGISANINLLASDGSSIYAVNSGYNIYLSPDSGNSWTNVTNGVTDSGRVINSIATQGANVLLGISGSDSLNHTTLIKTGGIFESTNNGANWSCLNNGFITSNDSDVNSVAVVGNNFFAGTAGGVLLSTDNGNSWSEMNNGLTSNPYVSLIAGSGNNIFTTIGPLYRSLDNGSNWAIDTNGMGNNYIQSFLIAGNYIFAGTQSGGVYLSTDTGYSWHAVNDGLGNVVSVISLVATGDTVYAGTNSQGIWKRSISELASGIKEPNYNNAEILIFPNPVIDLLNVVRNTNMQSEIVLYDITSRKTLQQQFTNSVSLNTGHLAKGIYIYEVRDNKGLCGKGKVVKH